VDILIFELTFLRTHREHFSRVSTILPSLPVSFRCSVPYAVPCLRFRLQLRAKNAHEWDKYERNLSMFRATVRGGMRLLCCFASFEDILDIVRPVTYLR